VRSLRSQLTRKQRRKGDIIVKVSVRQILAVFRYLFGWKRRKRQEKINAETLNTRKLHLVERRLISKD